MLLEQVYCPLSGALSVQELHQLVDGGEVARHGGLLQQGLGPGAGERLLEQDRGVQGEGAGRVGQVLTGTGSYGHCLPLSREAEITVNKALVSLESVRSKAESFTEMVHGIWKLLEIQEDPSF